MNERGTFRKEIPSIQWNVDTKLRLACCKNDNHYISEIQSDDLIIKENQVIDDDILYIVDKDNQRFELYRYEHDGNRNRNRNRNIDDEMDDRCFVM